MSVRLELHEDADLEMNEAAAYYDRESANLGGVFLDAVAAGFKRIREHPDSGPKVGGGARKLVLPGSHSLSSTWSHRTGYGC